LSAGLQRNSWSVNVYVNNVFDKRAAQYKYTECGVDVCGAHGVVPQYPNGQVYTGFSMPRTIGVRFRQDF
jgi:outer membrane receptor protein involved in Fe transport